MQMRNVVTTLALAASTLAPLTSFAASFVGPDGNAPTTSVKAPKGKQVKFTLKNVTTEAMTVMINDQAVTIAANSSMTARATAGSNVLSADGSTVRLHVTPEINDATVSFR